MTLAEVGISVCGDVVCVEVFVAADVEFSAADDGVCEVVVCRFGFDDELGGDFESVFGEVYQVHCALVVDGVDLSFGDGDSCFSDCFVDLDCLAGLEVDAVELFSAESACGTVESAVD